MKNSFLNMVLVLSLVSLIAATSLAVVNELTKESIAKAQEEKLIKAIAMVTPEFDSLKTYNMAPPKNIGDQLSFYEVRKEGKLVGTAVKSWTDKAFSGRMWVIVGFLPNGVIYNSNVLQHKETPGLGDKTDSKKSDWNEQFKAKDPAKFSLTVSKDGGDVDAITAATISSRAYCDAVQRAYDVYANKQIGSNKDKND